ncbi:MAG: RNA polymerase sigma factor [Marmoricola sp.]
MRDDDVIALAKEGDAEAWRQLYRLHASRLSALMRLVPTGDNAVANEDLVAHAWLTAADRIATFSGDTDAFGGWLYAIARNQGAHARRKSGHAAAPIATGSGIELAESAAGLAEEAGAELERMSWIRDVLAELPPKQRDVIACMDVVGMGIEATGQALGLSASAVRVNRHRGLARLRKTLGEAENVS